MELARSGCCYLFRPDINWYNQGIELGMDKYSEENDGVLPTLALLMAGDISGATRCAQVASNHLCIKTVPYTWLVDTLSFISHY